MVPFAVLLLGLYTASGIAAPPNPRCRCVTVDETLPWTTSPSLLAASGEDDLCSRLGPELERWRVIEPVGFEAYFKDLVEEVPPATPTEDEERPLSTTVLMELARRRGFDPEGPPHSAPSSISHERIICRAELVKAGEYHPSNSSLYATVAVLAMVLLAFGAEVVGVVVSRIYHSTRGRKGELRLQGDERDLRAFEPQPTGYTSALDDGDEDYTRPVL